MEEHKVKLGSVHETIRSLETVRDRPDRHDQNQGRKQQKDSEKKKEEKPSFQVTEQKVVDAISAFQSDEQNRANGLNASVTGQGPGLKVVLKDGRGAVVRQFTGEEFVQLREAARDGRPRGKILDQKF